VVFVGDTASEPLVALVPVHPPEAVHAVALVEDHVRVELPPVVMLVALANKLAVGVAPVVTVTVEVADDVPPDPVQVSV
jgi:hypothetical protein